MPDYNVSVTITYTIEDADDGQDAKRKFILDLQHDYNLFVTEDMLDVEEIYNITN